MLGVHPGTSRTIPSSADVPTKQNVPSSPPSACLGALGWTSLRKRLDDDEQSATRLNTLADIEGANAGETISAEACAAAIQIACEANAALQ